MLDAVDGPPQQFRCIIDAITTDYNILIRRPSPGRVSLIDVRVSTGAQALRPTAFVTHRNVVPIVLAILGRRATRSPVEVAFHPPAVTPRSVELPALSLPAPVELAQTLRGVGTFAAWEFTPSTISGESPAAPDGVIGAPQNLGGFRVGKILAGDYCIVFRRPLHSRKSLSYAHFSAADWTVGMMHTSMGSSAAKAATISSTMFTPPQPSAVLRSGIPL